MGGLAVPLHKYEASFQKTGEGPAAYSQLEHSPTFPVVPLQATLSSEHTAGPW